MLQAQPGDRDHDQGAECHAEQRRDEDEDRGLDDARRQQRRGAGLGDRRADHAADQRMRGTRRDAVVPGDQVPGDRADQRAEDHVVVDRDGIDDALADGRRHFQVEDEDGDEVEERRPRHRVMRAQHAGRDDRGNRVRGVVKAIHEIERKRQRDQHHQRGKRKRVDAGIRRFPRPPIR